MHEQFDDLLQQYIDSDLGVLEKIILEEHLANCQICRRNLNHLKLMDWDLKHRPVIEVPPELESYRKAAINNYLAQTLIAEIEPPIDKNWYLQQHIMHYTFSFISYNPVNRSVTRSAKKAVSLFTRAAGKSIKKRRPLFARFIPGQA